MGESPVEADVTKLKIHNSSLPSASAAAVESILFSKNSILPNIWNVHIYENSLVFKLSLCFLNCAKLKPCLSIKTVPPGQTIEGYSLVNMQKNFFTKRLKFKINLSWRMLRLMVNKGSVFRT